MTITTLSSQLIPRDMYTISAHTTISCTAGRVTAMEICNGMVCLACNSTEQPLIVLRLYDLHKARHMPLREGKSVREWISGYLGTSQPPCVACMVNVPVPGCPDALAVLYTSGLLSVWEPDSGRHLCQMVVGAAANAQQEGPTQPFTVSGLYASSSLTDVPWFSPAFDSMQRAKRPSTRRRLIACCVSHCVRCRA